jgi:hypothetical protein
MQLPDLPIDETPLAYDHVEKHGWHSNLDLTVEELSGGLRDGDIVLDYLGGTGILLDRARLRIFERQVGWLIVDASAKFLRVAVEKYYDDERMRAHAEQRDRVFLKPRPLQSYLDALGGAGLTVVDVCEKTIIADGQEWFELMTAYHDTVLGWVGGTKKLDGGEASPEALADRMAIMRKAMETIFDGRQTCNACWTYMTCEKAAEE